MRSPSAVKATTDGVVRCPSELGITTGSLPSITATQELVVPKSIPIIFAIIVYEFNCLYFFRFLSVPPEFFRPAGPERRSRPEFEQRLYQTAISAKLSAEWQTGPGISPRKAGCKVLFCQKRRGDQAAEGGGFFEERQTDGTAAERHGKQLPQTRRPGFRGYKSRGPDRTAAEREAAQRRAINNPRQGIDNGRRPTNGGR